MLEAVSIARSRADVFGFVSDRYMLPRWTRTFRSVTALGAEYETPQGVVTIGLEVTAGADSGVVDWTMRLPAGAVERAYTRAIAEGECRTNLQFFFAPTLPPEKLTEMITFFSGVVRDELAALKSLLEAAA